MPFIIISSQTLSMVEVSRELAGFFRTWNLEITASGKPSNNVLGQAGCLPPGAVGGLYGSGCFHFSSSFSVSLNSICGFLRQQRFLQEQWMEFDVIARAPLYPLLSVVCDIPVRIKE
jgi:hypothetical protein